MEVPRDLRSGSHQAINEARLVRVQVNVSQRWCAVSPHGDTDHLPPAASLIHQIHVTHQKRDSPNKAVQRPAMRIPGVKVDRLTWCDPRRFAALLPLQQNLIRFDL